MSFVSKQELDDRLEKKLYEQLADLFTAHQSPFDNARLIYELFTATERLMFAKRLGIIALLERGYSAYSIALALNVSQSTVARIDANLQKGKYKHMIKNLKNKRYRESIIGTLETLLTLGFPGVAAKKAREQIRNDINAWKRGAN